MNPSSLEQVLKALIDQQEFRHAFERDRSGVVSTLDLPKDVKQTLLTLDVHALVAAGTSVHGTLLKTLDI